MTLSDTLNSKLSYVSASTTVGTCAYASGSRTVTCSIGTLANAAQATVTIVANAAGHGNVIERRDRHQHDHRSEHGQQHRDGLDQAPLTVVGRRATACLPRIRA